MTRVLLRGGRVHTLGGSPATAVCVEDGRVAWAGADEGAHHFVDNADRVVDLGGRLVTPAFVDAHAHLAQTGLAAMGADLSAARSIPESLDLLAHHARTSSMSVVLGFGWDETRWPEGRPFTRAELDRVVGGRPAYVSRVDAHSAVVSTALLDAAPGVARADGYTPDGRVERDAHHEVRSALFLLVSPGTRADAVRSALQSAAAAGIGLVHELGAPHISPPGDFELLSALDGPLPEVVGYWGELDGADHARELGCEGAAGDLCVDGAIGSRTAALHAPYADDDTSTGHLYLDADQIARHVVACTRTGLQAGFHVIGDRAVAEMVAGFQAAADALGTAALRSARHRVEHLEMVSPEQTRVLAELGVTASVQPMFDGLWGRPDGLYETRLGERAAAMNPFGSLLRAGVPLAFGSDTPVTPFDPWAAVRAAVWHHDPDQRLSVGAALDAHTSSGWRAARRDDGGVIAVGAPASLAVWDVACEAEADLPDLRPELDLPRCALTMVRGRVAFDESGVLT
jgi:predicted amidohydrolase YtcJ